MVFGDYWYMMPPKGRKRCRNLLPDVLSNLPHNVIDVILMCLPCKDAVRTSILSRKWRYHWCRLTALTFDSSLWKAQKDLLHPTDKFKKIICQILSLHEGPITKFTLNISFLENGCPNIDNFLSFLSRNYIQHLVLRFPWDILYKLPSSLFTCSQLRHLVKVSLTGYDMKAEDLDFAKVFKSCSALENLILNFFSSQVYCGDENEDEDDDHILESLELEHLQDVTFSRLREVKLECFAGTTLEMQLIKLLLAKSPVLVRMLIDTCNLDDEPLETRLQISAEVSNFLCASHEAEVIYEKFKYHIDQSYHEHWLKCFAS